MSRRWFPFSFLLSFPSLDFFFFLSLSLLNHADLKLLRLESSCSSQSFGPIRGVGRRVLVSGSF